MNVHEGSVTSNNDEENYDIRKRLDGFVGKNMREVMEKFGTTRILSLLSSGRAIVRETLTPSFHEMWFHFGGMLDS